MLIGETLCEVRNKLQRITCAVMKFVKLFRNAMYVAPLKVHNHVIGSIFKYVSLH